MTDLLSELRMLSADWRNYAVEQDELAQATKIASPRVYIERAIIARHHADALDAALAAHPTCRLVREPQEEWKVKISTLTPLQLARIQGAIDVQGDETHMIAAYLEFRGFIELAREIRDGKAWDDEALKRAELAAPAGRVVPPPPPQIDLDEKAATVLRENLSKLYEDDPSRVDAPGSPVDGLAASANQPSLWHCQKCKNDVASSAVIYGYTRSGERWAAHLTGDRTLCGPVKWLDEEPEEA